MAPGVAGALIATVVGLFVAIPAMFAYNYMVTTIRAITQELDNFTAEDATADHIVRIEHGRIVSVTPGPFITPNYAFALRAKREPWEKLWSATPIPGYTDIFALVKKKLLRIEGDLHPLMSNLLYFKGVIAAAGESRQPAQRHGEAA